MANLSPSLLACNFFELEKNLDILKNNGIKYLHLDVMDGNFVPNISFGPAIIKQIREKYPEFILDCHLMVNKPENIIDDMLNAGADIITFHPESTFHPHRIIQTVHKAGKKCGLALNPSTGLDCCEYIIDDLDIILVMSVNPGFGGQSFIESQYSKIKDARKMIEKSQKDIILEVDGGVKTSNVDKVLESGANLIVSGSDVFNQNIESQLDIYNEKL
ncbi:ribulose-phosphate 3-epimerase [Finegoldia magna]|uniref:ribulose-phosphate 3-epimerase n=1 Tax=Finegoldia magna TaxID=1260 RepID=UPI000B91BC13|nr:ribulose-phosphate 3-epimerase [Finegoldia magna]MCA5587888.1 ribulose-phosphate 3-epimerase [Finegoldia magna]MDU1011234.1 ribulose-phosphate 3-epimerase [Finegoldia magna]MDU1087439.1 ribulose-phosphate 3-epimerase [Finegoldia magna]MDU1578808.1 ribulose-phosphate 3-epimerase [Finegoldia magna]MDU1600629.1 ribulose-phosphate 3-epimerase [Finegoldia magna]